MINLQCPAFLDVNNFCNKHLFTKLLSQFTAVHVVFFPRWSVLHTSPAIFWSHVDIYSLYQVIFYVCVSGLCLS